MSVIRINVQIKKISSKRTMFSCYKFISTIFATGKITFSCTCQNFVSYSTVEFNPFEIWRRLFEQIESNEIDRHIFTFSEHRETMRLQTFPFNQTEWFNRMTGSGGSSRWWVRNHKRCRSANTLEAKTNRSIPRANLTFLSFVHPPLAFCLRHFRAGLTLWSSHEIFHVFDSIHYSHDREKHLNESPLK